MIVKTISSWKPLSRESTYKVIRIANNVHTYFSLLIFCVHSHHAYNHEDFSSLAQRISTSTDQTYANLLVKKYPKEVHKYDIINTKMHRNPSSIASETYEFKIFAFEYN